MFESVDAFRAHCGEPTMPLDGCAICREIPERCDRQSVSSIVSDFDVDYGDERGYNHVPAPVAQLVTLFEETRDKEFKSRDLGGWLDRSVLQCPACRRLYLLADCLEMIGARNYHTWTYERIEASALFEHPWGVAQRTPVGSRG